MVGFWIASCSRSLMMSPSSHLVPALNLAPEAGILVPGALHIRCRNLSDPAVRLLQRAGRRVSTDKTKPWSSSFQRPEWVLFRGSREHSDEMTSFPEWWRAQNLLPRQPFIQLMQFASRVILGRKKSFLEEYASRPLTGELFLNSKQFSDSGSVRRIRR